MTRTVAESSSRRGRYIHRAQGKRGRPCGRPRVLLRPGLRAQCGVIIWALPADQMALLAIHLA